MKAHIVTRVLIGPKKVRGGFARIVAEKDGSGCIESFDIASRTWSVAADSVTFSEVWSAPSASVSAWASIGNKPRSVLPRATPAAKEANVSEGVNDGR
jgi:hypothetical protein